MSGRGHEPWLTYLRGRAGILVNYNVNSTKWIFSVVIIEGYETIIAKKGSRFKAALRPPLYGMCSGASCAVDLDLFG